MAHTLSSSTTTEAGTKQTDLERKAVEIVIGVIPGQPLSLRLYYGDCEKTTFTPVGGGASTVTERCLDRVGMVEVPQEEVLALPSFAAVRADLKSLADAKAAQKWPEIVTPL